MATQEEKVEAFVQDVYLARYNRFIDDIKDEDGVIEVDKVVSWTNMLVEELELEADWQYLRDSDLELGTISAADDSFELDDDIRKIVVHEDRPLMIQQDGVIVSVWEVVDPNLVGSANDSPREDRVTTVNGILVFSRPFRETEIGGAIVADVINKMPLLSRTKSELIELVKPRALLIQGVSKNATLPDIVQGGLSPSFAQKYNDLLTKAIAENERSSVSMNVGREDYSHIGGVY